MKSPSADSAICLLAMHDLAQPEFLTYAVYRLWHKTPGSESFMPPASAREWFPCFISATQRLLERAGSQVHVLLALLYIARLRMALPRTTLLQQGSEYKILVAALLLAHKYHSDDRFTNASWSEWSGLSTLDIHSMEREFLSGISNHLFVKSEEFNLWQSSVQILAQEYSLYKKVLDLDSKVAQDEQDYVLAPRHASLKFKVANGKHSHYPLPRSKTWGAKTKLRRPADS